MQTLSGDFRLSFPLPILCEEEEEEEERATAAAAATHSRLFPISKIVFFLPLLF